jgi:hypothetical protein
MGESLAQTAAAPPPAGDHHPGYQHSFDQAEIWAKEFDDPARDAWQKPDKILDALQLGGNLVCGTIGKQTSRHSHFVLTWERNSAKSAAGGTLINGSRDRCFRRQK